MANTGLVYGENWTKRNVSKWPTLFYQLHHLVVPREKCLYLSPWRSRIETLPSMCIE
jgi:hypothetical protein